MTDKGDDDPNGAAQQRPPEEITTPVQRPIDEEVKEPELPLTVRQPADPNQATLQAFSSILAQQLEEKLREQREMLEN